MHGDGFAFGFGSARDSWDSQRLACLQAPRGGVTCKSKSLKKQGLRLRFAVGTCKSGVELPSNDGSLSGERAAMEPH